jgi:carbonic anhydrase/acetyltransferase-like protein (isoleucine patch superfamily)
MVYAFKHIRPVIHPTAFIHPQANVTGQVLIGRDVYIGPGAVIRGDWGRIIIEDGCNVQENCTLHMFPGLSVKLCTGAHIGHGAVIHGAEIGENVLVGMNSVIMDGVKIGKNSIIGALTFLKAESIIPDKSLVVGNPGRIVRELSDEMIQWKTQGTQLYQQLANEAHASIEPCEPLTEIPEDWGKVDGVIYRPWNK